MPPAPAGQVGLRYWTVVLDAPEDVEQVRDRTRAAGVEVEGREGVGFLVRDPWGIAAFFVSDATSAW